MALYDIDLSECEDVTAEVAEHLEVNGWSADAPEYTYDNVLIWDGGMGNLLLQDRVSGSWYYAG